MTQGKDCVMWSCWRRQRAYTTLWLVNFCIGCVWNVCNGAGHNCSCGIARTAPSVGITIRTQAP